MGAADEADANQASPRTEGAAGHPVFPVVGLGASAGGLASLREFFTHVSASGVAYVVILHLSPDYESQAASVLQQHSTLPVTQVTTTVRLEPDHIYVIPPAKQLSMTDGHLRPDDPDSAASRRVPIDHFFRTLADVHGRLAAAIILSGTGSDGSLGIKRIKEQGGVVMVQDPQEAQHDGMPRSAITTGMADFVLPVAAMPDVLTAYWRRGSTLQLPAAEPERSAPESEALRDIFAVLRVRTGHDFSQYKRPTMLRRIGRRMQVTGVPDLPSYLGILRSRPDEVHALLQDLLISVTNFFRDPAAWVALEAIIPRVFAGKSSGDQVRVWVAGCASGEEAYTTAILLTEYAQTLDRPPEIQIFATDIDEGAVLTARQGFYPDTIVGDVAPERLRRSFDIEQGGFRIKPEIRDLILFAPHNILRDPPFSKLDLITCRNVLIYLNRDIQENVIRLFHFGLQPAGYLLLGNSESLDDIPGLFTVVDKTQRLFQRRGYVLPPSVALPQVASRSATPPRASVPHEAEDIAGSLPDLHRQLLAEYAPPSLIVNGEYQIVHLSRGASRYLHIGDGEPSYNLLRVALPELRLELRTALFAAAQQSIAETRQVRVAQGDGHRRINLTVQQLGQPDWAKGYFLIIFNDVGEAVESGPERGADELVRQLEAELGRTQDQLRTTVEQYETAVEEYKAANEELQAINEELRAATEELETSKEELQSLNEELTTVNQELRYNVDEVSQANNDLNNLITSTQIGTIFLDRELRIKRFTPSAQTIFNLIPTDLNRPIGHITHGLRYNDLASDAAKVLQSLAGISHEVQSANGLWYLMRMLPYRTAEDHIDGIVITFIDITERTAAVEDLRESEQRLAHILEQLPVGVLIAGPDGNITYGNPRAEAIYGQPSLRSRGVADYSTWSPHTSTHEPYAPEQVPLTRALLRREIVTGEEVHFLKPDRTWLPTLVNAAPLLDRQGNLTGGLVTFEDITTLKQIQIERDQAYVAETTARAEAEAAVQLRDEFLSIASHELRTPLTSLNGYAHLLLQRLRTLYVEDSVTQRMAGTIGRQAQRLDNLIGQMLDVTRLQRGQFTVELAPLDLRAIVERVSDEFRLGFQTNTPSRSIELTLPDVPTLIQGDADRIEEVLLNLLSNAVKYSPLGGPITVRLTRLADEAVIEVTDRGIGIPADAQEHLFQAFYRGSNVSPTSSGFGVGLFVAREIVARHDGQITVSSREGQGSTFRITLPLLRE